MGQIFSHQLRVRYSECDQQGVVFNGHYLFFYDVALTEFWRAAVCGPDEMVGAGYDLVVAAFGGHGELVERAADLPGAIERALASGKPACINIMIEPTAAPVIRL